MNNKRKIDFDDVDEIDASSRGKKSAHVKRLGNNLNSTEDEREISGSINDVVNEKLEVMNEFPGTIGKNLLVPTDYSEPEN